MSVDMAITKTSWLRRIPLWIRSCGVMALIGIWALALAYPAIVSALGGAWRDAGPNWSAELSPAARQLLDDSFADLDEGRLVDVHTHLAGIGTGGSGCEVHPHMRSWSAPVSRVRFELYLSASGVKDLDQADQEFCERLHGLIESSPRQGRFCLLAFDHAYTQEGELDRETSEFHVPNDWVFAQALRNPERLIPAISVHPYRPDALEELDRCAARGARLLKWLPNAMGMDPASPLCDDFYDKLVEHDITLLSHTGMEMAVDADERQAFGNPLRLRRALDRGVRVIAAHCASLGDDVDLDQPEGEREKVPSFDLFMRMMEEERYEGLLFGEISAVVQVNRLSRPLEVLLAREDLHHRLVNGSDYPLPALNAVIHLSPLVSADLLSEEDADLLEEIYRVHPLAFDFALKRRLRSPKTGRGFPPEVFLVPEAMGL